MATTPDSSGHGHDGTLAGSPNPYQVPSPWPGFGNAMQFAGSGGCGVNCGQPSTGVPAVAGVGAAASLTMEARVALLTAGATGAICGWYDGETDSPPQLWVQAGDLQFFWTDDGGTPRSLTTGGAPLDDLAGHEAAAAYDGTTMRLLLDGAVVASMVTTGVAAPPGADHFWIGNDDLGDSLHAIIDEVRWSDVARYTGAYTPAAGPFVADAGCLALYHLDTGAVPPPVPPTVSGFNPTTACPGTKVGIVGTGFTGATSVAFTGAAAPFTVQSDTLIQAVVPSGAQAGPITVSNPAGSATSTASFTPWPGVTILADLADITDGEVLNGGGAVYSDQLCRLTDSLALFVFNGPVAGTLDQELRAKPLSVGASTLSQGPSSRLDSGRGVARTSACTLDTATAFVLYDSQSGTAGQSSARVVTVTSPASAPTVSAEATILVTNVAGSSPTLPTQVVSVSATEVAILSYPGNVGSGGTLQVTLVTISGGAITGQTTYSTALTNAYWVRGAAALSPTMIFVWGSTFAGGVETEAAYVIDLSGGSPVVGTLWTGVAVSSPQGSVVGVLANGNVLVQRQVGVGPLESVVYAEFSVSGTTVAHVGDSSLGTDPSNNAITSSAFYTDDDTKIVQAWATTPSGSAVHANAAVRSDTDPTAMTQVAFAASLEPPLASDAFGYGTGRLVGFAGRVLLVAPDSADLTGHAVLAALNACPPTFAVPLRQTQRDDGLRSTGRVAAGANRATSSQTSSRVAGRSSYL